MKTSYYSKTWLPFLKGEPCADVKTPLETARAELADGLRLVRPGQNGSVECRPEMGDAFEIALCGGEYHITGGETGCLYGVYRLLISLASGEAAPVGKDAPCYALRMLNCWDNADGSVERGYAGRSLFFKQGGLDYDPARIRQLARMLSSVGINAVCVNNVNVSPPSDRLIMSDGLAEAAKLAALFRPFGIRLILAVDYASPLLGGLSTADPLDEDVVRWWAERCEEIYRSIPDFCGFLVKADSENRPGPYTYGCNHAQGANMLARALKPHGGVLIWRCFVYNCKQDWRDGTVDRPKAAYEHYAGLDGRFEENVILQIKHGPFDFQVREPLSPLLLAMPGTTKAMEVQLTQEYTGHQIDLYAMPWMWKELFQALPKNNIRMMAAVGNLGDDPNWTGHDFAQLNLFAFGLYAWNPDRAPEAVTRQWIRASYGLFGRDEDALCRLLCLSRTAYEKYTAPLGLCWMVNPMGHYGPSPDGYEYSVWGTFHKADRNAVGIDRTREGTGYVDQYPEPLRSMYADLASCPEELILFFHRLPYGYLMKDGRTLLQRIYDDHFEGVEMAEEMDRLLGELKLPQNVRKNVRERMEKQLLNAREWRDVINHFFYRFSGVDDCHGRRIYHG